MHQRTRNCYCLLLLVLSIAAPALAEVMDKEPSVREIWRSATPLTVLAFAGEWGVFAQEGRARFRGITLAALP
jgi:hypothetical protein